MRLAVAAQLLAVAALSLPAAASAKSTTGKPLVSTGPVTHVRGTTGTLTGSINPHGEGDHLLLPVRPDDDLRLADPDRLAAGGATRR